MVKKKNWLCYVPAAWIKVLTAIANNPDGIRLAKAVTQTGTNYNTVYPICNELERRGLIRLEKIDGRSKMAHITPKGDEIVQMSKKIGDAVA